MKCTASDIKEDSMAFSVQKDQKFMVTLQVRLWQNWRLDLKGFSINKWTDQTFSKILQHCHSNRCGLGWPYWVQSSCTGPKPQSYFKTIHLRQAYVEASTWSIHKHAENKAFFFFPLQDLIPALRAVWYITCKIVITKTSPTNRRDKRTRQVCISWLCLNLSNSIILASVSLRPTHLVFTVCKFERAWLYWQDWRWILLFGS